MRKPKKTAIQPSRAKGDAEAKDDDPSPAAGIADRIAADVDRAIKSRRYIVFISRVHNGKIVTSRHSNNFPLGDVATAKAHVFKQFGQIK